MSDWLVGVFCAASFQHFLLRRIKIMIRYSYEGRERRKGRQARPTACFLQLVLAARVALTTNSRGSLSVLFSVLF